MGEAGRRKQSDPSWGKFTAPKPPDGYLPDLGCFLYEQNQEKSVSVQVFDYEHFILGRLSQGVFEVQIGISLFSLSKGSDDTVRFSSAPSSGVVLTLEIEAINETEAESKLEAFLENGGEVKPLYRKRYRARGEELVIPCALSKLSSETELDELECLQA